MIRENNRQAFNCTLFARDHAPYQVRERFMRHCQMRMRLNDVDLLQRSPEVVEQRLGHRERDATHD